MSKLAQDAQKTTQKHTHTQLAKEVGAQSSQLGMKCDAAMIHHTTLHYITYSIT